MIRSLLVAYDGSHGARVALQHAVDLASRCEGRIALLTGSKGTESDADLLPDGQPDPVALAQDLPEPEDEQSLPSETDEALAEVTDLCRELTVRCWACPVAAATIIAKLRISIFMMFKRVEVVESSLDRPALGAGARLFGIPSKMRPWPARVVEIGGASKFLNHAVLPVCDILRAGC